MLPCENRSEGNGKNLADILEDENLISPLEKIALKEKINKYEGTFL